MLPLVFITPSSFEAVCCCICDLQRVAVTRHQMIGIVLISTYTTQKAGGGRCDHHLQREQSWCYMFETIAMRATMVNKARDPKSHTCLKNWSEDSQSMALVIWCRTFKKPNFVVACGIWGLYATVTAPCLQGSEGEKRCANHKCKFYMSNLDILVAWQKVPYKKEDIPLQRPPVFS